jgi:hypothetical protein
MPGGAEDDVVDRTADERPEPGNELKPPAAGDEDQPRRRRRRRGGRRHRRRRERQAGAAGAASGVQPNGEHDVAESEDSSEDDTQGPAANDVSPEPPPSPQRVPPPRASLEPDKPVVRTGSTDKHLIRDDVPVNPEPPRRPRTYRDLDAIPDDLD